MFHQPRRTIVRRRRWPAMLALACALLGGSLFSAATASAAAVNDAFASVHVQTHDVAIARFPVPGSARVGQTKRIVVDVSNLLFPEVVQVQLLASNRGQFDQVGLLKQSVPVTGRSQSVPFTFNYTFTSDDAANGGVVFQAVATLVGTRDARLADNSVTAIETKVKP